MNFNSNICRICESTDAIINLAHDKHVRIIEMLQSIADVSFSKEDALPKSVCQSCNQNISQSFTFKNQIETTDRKLRNLLKGSRCLDDEQSDSSSEDDKHIGNFELMMVNGDDEDDDTEERQTKDTIKTEPEEHFELMEDDIKPFECVDTKMSITAGEELSNKSQRKNVYRPLSTKHQYPRTRLTKIDKFECYDCKKQYTNWNSLIRHYRYVHLGLPPAFNCDICSKKFYNLGNLKRHIKSIHEKVHPYKCTMCYKTFAQKIHCVYHEMTHNTGHPFKCPLCDKQYKCSQYLKQHHLDCHTDRKNNSTKKTVKKKRVQVFKTKTCEYCGKQFSECNYRNHVRTHTGEKPYKCDVCDKRFVQIATLRIHAMIHTDDRPHHCTMCDLKFRQSGQLRTHILVHTGEKPHKCNFCGKSFAQKGNLTCHIRQHTGETPFHCTLCPDKFFDLNGLKRHRKVHQKN